MVNNEREACGMGEYSAKGNGTETVFDEKSVYPHGNHIEASGFYCSSIVSCRVNKRRWLTLYRYVNFPYLRVNPNEAGGSLAIIYKTSAEKYLSAIEDACTYVMSKMNSDNVDEYTGGQRKVLDSAFSKK